jgi:hypothetical protein
MLEVFLGKPPAPSSTPDFEWPISANVPLPLELLSGHDIITIELPPGSSGPAAGIQINAGSGFNRLEINSGKVRMDSVAVGGVLDIVVSNGAELVTSRFDHVSLALQGAGSKATILSSGETSVVRKLVVDQNSTFDITDSSLVVDYTGQSPLAAIRVSTLFGRGGAGIGAGWDGTGIISSIAAAANAAEPEKWSVGYAENAAMPLGPYKSFRGVLVDATAVLIAFTRTGDANLDGVVNDDDVTIVGANYAPGMAKPDWAMGDFDYNSFVDDDDVTLLGAFYQPRALAGAPPTLVRREVSIAADARPVVRGSSDPAHASDRRSPSSLGATKFAEVSRAQIRTRQPQITHRSGESARNISGLIDLLAESIAAQTAGGSTELREGGLALRNDARTSKLWAN